MTIDNVTDYLGLTGENAKNENGTYEITAADSLNVVITGLGTAIRNGFRPQIITTVTLADDGVTAQATDEPVE